MDARFAPVAFAEVEGAVRRHLAALPAAIDAFLEDHVLASVPYRIEVAGEAAGFAAVHGEQLITLFALDERYRRYGQPLFGQLRRLEQVRSAFVPTCDGFFLAHALDDYRGLAKQAYFFAAAEVPPAASAASWALRPVGPDEAGFVREQTGDFFAPVERYLVAGQLFATLRGGEAVGFGLLVASALYDDVASVGMYTLAPFRRQGVGTATIALLIAACRRRGLRPVAGCWYYNHASKRTLERAGLYAPTRLLKVDY